MNSNCELIENYLLKLQDDICKMLQLEDISARFIMDSWKREAGGGGKTCIFADGKDIEKAAVNFSNVTGDCLPASASQKNVDLSGAVFVATGVSVIVHPRNPYVPTTHFNVRYFQATTKENKIIWWFGGGFDLTPYYAFVEDCVHWHTMAKKACDSLTSESYFFYKKQADDYFYLKHRQEPRGIGGIFFDDLHDPGFEKSFGFIKEVGRHFILAYQPILSKRKNYDYSERERDFQNYRRGRYVEFNLIYDRGTHFGLQSGGRTESILASLPPEVIWRYDWQPDPGSPEAKLYEEFLVVRDWV